MNLRDLFDNSFPDWVEYEQAWALRKLVSRIAPNMSDVQVGLSVQNKTYSVFADQNGDNVARWRVAPHQVEFMVMTYEPGSPTKTHPGFDPMGWESTTAFFSTGRFEQTIQTCEELL